MENFLAGFQHRFHERVQRCFQSAFPSLIWLSTVFFFPSFVDVRYVYTFEYTLITSLPMFWCFHVLPDLSQLLHLSCGQILSPCFKASPLDWKSVESCSFKSFNMTFNFSTIPLCSLMDQFSLLLSLGCNWYPGIENSLPHKRRFRHYCTFWNEPLSWCSCSNALFPGWINNIANACFPETMGFLSYARIIEWLKRLSHLGSVI